MEVGKRQIFARLLGASPWVLPRQQRPRVSFQVTPIHCWTRWAARGPQAWGLSIMSALAQHGAAAAGQVLGSAVGRLWMAASDAGSHQARGGGLEACDAALQLPLAALRDHASAARRAWTSFFSAFVLPVPRSPHHGAWWWLELTLVEGPCCAVSDVQSWGPGCTFSALEAEWASACCHWIGTRRGTESGVAGHVPGCALPRICMVPRRGSQDGGLSWGIWQTQCHNVAIRGEPGTLTGGVVGARWPSSPSYHCGAVVGYSSLSSAGCPWLT